MRNRRAFVTVGQGLASQLEAVTREADRLRRAVDSGAVGSSAFDQAEAARLPGRRCPHPARSCRAAYRDPPCRAPCSKASALAAEAEAQDQRDRCEITPALDGQLDGFEVELEERVAAGQIIASVTGQTDVELELTIPASMFGTVAVGDNRDAATHGQRDYSHRLY